MAQITIPDTKLQRVIEERNILTKMKPVLFFNMYEWYNLKLNARQNNYHKGTKILKIVESFRTEKDEMLNQESIIPTFLRRVLAHC